MDGWTLVSVIALVISIALVAGIVLERFRQNAVVGYLLAGVVLGPGGLGWVKTGAGVEAVAGLGVALLLFTIGLEFSWKRLKAFGRLALGGGTLQVAATLGLFAAACLWMGLPRRAALVLGAAVSMSSTAVAVRVLVSRAELDSVHGRSTLGISLLQDIAVVPLLLVVGALSGEAQGPAALHQFGLQLLRGAVLVAAVMVAGRYLLPPLLHLAASLKNRDLPVLLAIAVFLVVIWASRELGQSPILGAFIAGMLLAETPFAEQIRADVIPLRAGFVTVFFASMGLLVEAAAPKLLITAVLPAAAIVAGKAAIAAAAVALFRVPAGAAAATGLSLANVGEFSFVLAQTARQAQILSEDVFQVFLMASLVTLLATPYLIAAASHVAAHWRPRPGAGAARDSDWSPPAGHVVVVGYGPAGQAVAEALEAARAGYVILELNPRTVAACRNRRSIALGDATQPEILDHAGVRSARALVITLPDTAAVRQIIRQAKALAPAVPVIARARHHIAVEELLGAGADAVVDEEEITGAELARVLAPYVH